MLKNVEFDKKDTNMTSDKIRRIGRCQNMIVKAE